MPNIASGSSPEVLGMIDLFWSIVVAVVLTCLVGLVDIPYRAKTPIKACFVGGLATYIMLFAAGNTIATLLASVILSTKLPASVQGGLPFFSAFLGVFAFHGVLSHTNITMFGKGTLTFEDWLAKARTNTVARANARYVQLTNQQRLTVAYVLKDLPEDELNTYIAQYLGSGEVAKLITSATQAQANVSLYKAMALAYGKPEETEAIMREVRRRTKP